MIRKFGLILIVPLALGACGTDKGERGVSRAGIGAAAGAVVGAVTGLTVVQGALIGAGVGGVTGVLTDKEDLDIGDPAWKSGQSGSNGAGSQAQGAQTANAYSPLVADIQGGLGRLGYDAGPADGVMGPRTRGAIESYQADNDLLVDGRASAELQAHIQSKIGG